MRQRAFLTVFVGRDRRSRVRGLRIGWLKRLQLWGPGLPLTVWSLPWVIRAQDSGPECESPIERVGEVWALDG